MHNVSVPEMLKIYGKWTQASEFETFVSERLGVTTRQAHNLIKKAVSKNQIQRLTLQNKRVIYGLPEFGKPARGFLDRVIEGFEKRAERRRLEREERYCNKMAPSMITYRKRASEGSGFCKILVEQEESLHPSLRINKREEHQ
jgi:predicted hydrocarbon binding protein